jgi:hypothetical protein
MSTSPAVGVAFTADLGDGTYRNPVLDADWSDPDVCRVGDDFFGPYEERIVLEQGDTDVNGPHQGGWVGALLGLFAVAPTGGGHAGAATFTQFRISPL